MRKYSHIFTVLSISIWGVRYFINWERKKVDKNFDNLKTKVSITFVKRRIYHFKQYIVRYRGVRKLPLLQTTKNASIPTLCIALRVCATTYIFGYIKNCRGMLGN